MSAKRTIIIYLVLVFAIVISGAHGGTEPIVTSDLLRIQRVTSIDVARDGTRAVFALESIGPNESEAHNAALISPAGAAQPPYGYRSHLYVVDLLRDDAKPMQLTYGERNDSSPVLSPRGDWVAFVRGDSHKSAKPQVWVMSLRGGEARPVTKIEHGASDPRWSPDGRRLLVASSIPMTDLPGAPPWSIERPQRSWKDIPEGVIPRPDGTRSEIRAWLEANAAGNDPSVFTRLRFQDEQSLQKEHAFVQLLLVDASGNGGQPIRLTDAFFNHEDARFTPDGRSVVYRRPVDPSIHPDRIQGSVIELLDLDVRTRRIVAQAEGMILSSPLPSNDGSAIAFLGEPIDVLGYGTTRLGVVSLAADSATRVMWLTDRATFDRDVATFRWFGDAGAMLLNTADSGGFPLLELNPGLLGPVDVIRELGGWPVGVHAFDCRGATIVYAATTPTNPCELRVRDKQRDRLLMDCNPWVAEKRLSMPQMKWITRPDGARVQYWVMPPTNMEPGRKYPTVLEIHGGPSAMWGPGEFTMWHEFQLLASWGYAVVYSNPRGSGGYGYDFQRGNYQNWGDGPAGDVLAALDHALLNAWIDSDRLVVTGGSYGGYLTAYIIGNDHRFKAAVAQRGVYDLNTFFGEGNAWVLVQWMMGGFPWEARIKPILQRESPFTYVNRIRTPLLILHASQDLRTGVSQSEMLYRAMKELKKPVEYVRYPDEGHELSRSGDPVRRMDRLNRIVEFFERHIDNPRLAPMASTDPHAGVP